RVADCYQCHSEGLPRQSSSRTRISQRLAANDDGSTARWQFPPNSSTEVTVGPFQWVPSQIGHECMFMVVSATGDPSNVSNIGAGDSIPEWRLVPNDNNIGQRNVFPVAAGNGLKGLVASLDGSKILIKNPLKTDARVMVQTILPNFLATG